MHWETITFIVALLTGLYRFLVLCGRVVTTLKAKVNAELGIKIQDQVFAIAERAVMITERVYQDSKEPQEKKSILKLHNATTIIVDVLLQNGLDPKMYNIPGLVDCAMFKLDL